MRDAELFRPMPENSRLLSRGWGSLPELGEYLVKVLDPEAGKRIEEVTYPDGPTRRFWTRRGWGNTNFEASLVVRWPRFYDALCVDVVYTSGAQSAGTGATSERSMASSMINIRADESKRALIDRAAAAVGKNRSEFMLEAACREATAVLIDRTFFHVDPGTYKKFITALDRAPSDNPALRKLLHTRAPWDR